MRQRLASSSTLISKIDMKPITAFFTPLIVAAAAYPVLWYLSLGYFYKGELWLDEIYHAKKHFALQEQEQKLLIVSGSNSLFSIDSERMTKLTGISTYNFGGSAGLTLGFLADQVLQVAKAGDIVLMPLEYDYYSRKEPTDWVLNNLQSWGFNHLRSYRTSESWLYFKSPDYAAVFQRLKARLRYHLKGSNLLIDPSHISYAAIPSGGPLPWGGYGLSSLNTRGDFFVSVEPLSEYAEKITTEGVAYPYEEPVTEYFVSELARFTSELADQNIELYLTWPVTASNPLMDVKDEVILANLLLFRERVYEKTGHTIICDPEISNLPANLFFDSSNHPNAIGAILRTELLASCLQHEVLNKSL